MRLDGMVERCKRMEERAAALYRAYAAASRAEPTLCALWTALAREEEEHANAIALARARLDPGFGQRTRLEGWDEALAEVEEHLNAAEQAGTETTATQQLQTALDLEMTELDAIRHELLATCGAVDTSGPDHHALRLAEGAERVSNDPQVRLQAALLRARLHLKSAGSTT
jgi:hypothetical protein